MSRKYLISLSSALFLTAFIVACRLWRPVADFYAMKIYPLLSAVLSWISSPFRFSLLGVAVILMVVLFIALIVMSVRRRSGWKKCLAQEALLLLWVFVWFYMGWCVNYSRSTIFQRTQTQRSQFDSTDFVSFLCNFTDSLNASYVEDKTVPMERIEEEIKSFYSFVPSGYGLCRPKPWQHAKRMLPQGYFSATGILGYMGPLFSEFHLNGDLLPEQIPFTWAHEYSHLLGVSSEAEANWWAWHACLSSSEPAVRYSAYASMLSYVWVNARRLLDEKDFESWKDTVSDEVMEDFLTGDSYWQSKRSPMLGRIQAYVHDIFLKGNNIPSGTKNYSEVVQMMMSVEYRI